MKSQFTKVFYRDVIKIRRNLRFIFVKFDIKVEIIVHFDLFIRNDFFDLFFLQRRKISMLLNE